MIKVDKIVNILEQDEKITGEISKSLKISELTSRVLYNRGITNINTAKEFINPILDRLHNPFFLTDMDKAIERIVQGIDKNESIWIYGDYDVDGVTSTSVLKLFFNSLGIDVKYYIPDRFSEGYGLNKDAIKYIHNEGGQLIITVDCGISSIEEVEYCNSLDMDIIVTDHHQCGKELPNALAIINPNREDNNYPFTKLAGVGLAFKVIEALSKQLSVSIDYKELLPIVAIGTVADVVSLTGENRIIVKSGLDLMDKSMNQGLRALLSITGLDNKVVTSGHIGFVIGPRINATGRIGSAKDAVLMLTSQNQEESFLLASKLNEENIKRQKIEGDILREAEALIEEDIDIDKEKVLVLAKEGWHAGVIGIVSSRITEKYYRPSIVIALEGELGKGSARSIPSFNLYESLYQCKDLFTSFGGHSQAAGLSLSRGNIEELRKEINRIADDILKEEDMIPEIIVDAEITRRDINIDIIKELKSLEPFGIDNPSPVFICRNARVKKVKQVGQNGAHLKLVLDVDGIEIDSIGFRLGNRIDELTVDDTIDIIASMDINDFTGQEKPQFNIRDIRTNTCINHDLTKDYYLSFVEGWSEKPELHNWDTDSSIPKPSSVDRLSYTMELLKNNSKVLVLVNNLFNSQDLVHELYISGRDTIKRVSVSYSNNSEKTRNAIIINPQFESIDFTNYDRVILFDLCFKEEHYLYLQKMLGQKLEYIFKIDDMDKNIFVLEEIMPEIDVLRKTYKALLTNKFRAFKIDTEQLLTYIDKTAGLKLSEHKLMVLLYILKEGNLIDYKLSGNLCFVKINEIPKKKIDIENLPIFRHFGDIRDYMIKLKLLYY